MPQTKKGHQFELDLIADVNENTPDEITSYAMGYSGNSKHAGADVLITTDESSHAIELKKTSQDRFTIQSDEIDKLAQCANTNTVAWVGIKYSHRQLCMIYAADFLCNNFGENPRGVLVKETPDCFNPRIGRTGTFITDKPDVSEWPSQQAGMEEWAVVCEAIGLDESVYADSKMNYDITEVDA